MFWLVVLALGGAPLLPSAALVLWPKTRPYALLPLWVILPLAGWFLGLLLGGPAPQGEKAAGPWIGILFILMSLLAMAVGTVTVGILLAFRSGTRKHASRTFGIVLSFVAAALIAFFVARLIPEWSESEPTAAILWRVRL